MFADEEIKDIPACDSSDQLISFRPIFPEQRPDHLVWPVSAPVSENPVATRSDPPTDGGGRWSWQKDNFCADFQDWWGEEERSVAAMVAHSTFGAPHLPFPDLEDAIKSELKEAEPACEYKLETPPLASRNSYSPPTVSSTSTSIVPEPPSSIDQGDIRLSEVARKVAEVDLRSGQHFVKYLKRHGRTTKMWECGVCGREFQHQYTLMRHLPTHTDERNFHCAQCGKSFRQLSTLSQHRAIHSSDRPYSCEVCRKTFNRVSTLISHRKTHSGHKPYKCHICPKGFYQKGNLRNHLFTHTNERPYRCNVCDKGFNQQSNLVCHKNKVHPDENGTYILPSTDSFAPTIQTISKSERSKKEHTVTTSSSQVSSISDSVQTMEVGSTSISQDSLQLTGSQWDWLREDSTMEPDLSDGVIVDPIKTYHMGVAQATRQTPFALLKPEHGAPVLVKVVETGLPGGKQMLVPATAEDLRIGGKITVNKNNQQDGLNSSFAGSLGAGCGVAGGALQIRVPVVATVVPRMHPGGQLLLAIEEPHASATSLSVDPLLLDVRCAGRGAEEGAQGQGCGRDVKRGFGGRVDDPVFGHVQAPAPPPPAPLPQLVSPCRGLGLFDAEPPAAPPGSADDIFVHLEQFPDQHSSFCIQLSDSE